MWEGNFLRLELDDGSEAVERERFASHLLVQERDGRIEASLTNLASGAVRSMAFADPPPEMQISPEGHWSLGPDRIGPWPWVSELCLTAGTRRRRAVVRLEGERLISLVLVIEARPGHPDPPPPPLRLPRQQDGGCLLWRAGPDLAVRTAATWVELQWQPEPGRPCRLRRAYSDHGLLLPLVSPAAL